MKKLYLNTDNILTLDATNITADTFKVRLSIVGEDGNVLLDNDGVDLILSSLGDNPELTFVNGKFQGTIHLASTAVKQYARAFWVVTTSADIPVVVTGYYPEEITIENAPDDATQTYEQMVVPAQYFIDSFLGAYPSISPEIVQTIAEINARNPDIFKRELLASQVPLEIDIRTKFFKTQFHLDRDMYDEDFRHSHWQQQVDWLPLITCDSFTLIYGNNTIVLSNDIKDSIKADTNLGFLEWLPIVTSTTLFAMVISTLSGIAITTFGTDYASRIPGLFRIIYTAGMDFPNLPAQDKEWIRRMVSRNCFCQIMPRIDSLMREASISQSIDGASLSRSSGVPKIIEGFKEDEKRDIALFQKKLGTNVAFVVS